MTIFTPRNILRFFAIMCAVFFFCPVFMVSCGNSGLGTELSAFGLANGTETQEETSFDSSYNSVLVSSIVENSGLDEISKPHYALYLLIIIPVLMILFLWISDIKNTNIAIIIMFLSAINLTVWGIFTYEVKKVAEGYMMLFKVTPWFVINMISHVIILVISFMVPVGRVRMCDGLLYRASQDDDYDDDALG